LSCNKGVHNNDVIENHHSQTRSELEWHTTMDELCIDQTTCDDIQRTTVEFEAL